MEQVNIIAVLAAAIASYIIGAVWYSALFKGPWMREMKFAPESMQGKGMGPKDYATGFLAELVTAYALAWFAAGFGGSPFLVAWWAWVGFQATLLLNSVMYEGKSWTLYGINAGYRLAALMAMAAAFALLG